MAEGMLREGWPSEAEQKRQALLYTAGYPEGYRAWCRSVEVPAVGRGMVEWEPESWHGAFDALVAEKKDLYVLKERDVRFTTDRILTHLWMLMWVPDFPAVYLTVDEAAAFNTVGSFQPRMEQIYRALPEWQRAACPVIVGPEGKFGTQGQVKVDHKWRSGASQPSTLLIAAATENVGAADAFAYGTFDECHRWEHADLTIESVRPSVRRTGGHFVAGGSAITKSRSGQRFMQMAQAARAGELPNAGALFIGWGAKKGETPERYAVMEAEARASGRQALFELRRSFPRTWEEAMAGQEGGLAESEALLGCWEAKEALPVPEELKKWARLGDLLLWEPVDAAGAYCYGLDPSGGRGGDPGALWVFNARTREQAALFRSRWAGYQTLGELAWALHQRYPVYRGNAHPAIQVGGGLVPEVNAANEVLMVKLREYFTDDYFHIQRKGAKPNKPEGTAPNFGFLTTGGSKTMLLDSFASALDRREFKFHDRFLIVENPYWRREGDKWEFNNDNDLEAGHGDVTFAGALAWQGVLSVGATLESPPVTKVTSDFYFERPGLQNARERSHV